AELDSALPAEAGRALALVDKIAPPAQLAYLRGRMEELRGGRGAELRAAGFYHDALRADATSVDAGLALSRLLARTGQNEAARAALEEVEKRASTDAMLRDRVGEAYLATGE